MATLSVEPLSTLPPEKHIYEIPEETMLLHEEVCEGVYCSCVTTVRLFLPEAPLINAKDYVPNSIPRGGGVVIMYYPKSGLHHIAYIEELLEDTIHIKEGNFKRGQYTERFISYDDPRILGFWYPQ